MTYASLTADLATLNIGGYDHKILVYEPAVTDLLGAYTDISRYVESWSIDRNRGLAAAELELRIPLQDTPDLSAVLVRMAPIVVETLLQRPSGVWESIRHGVFYIHLASRDEDQLPGYWQVTARDALMWASLDYYEGRHEPERVWCLEHDLSFTDYQTFWDALAPTPGNWCPDRAFQLQIKWHRDDAFDGLWWCYDPDNDYYPFSMYFGDGRVVFDSPLPSVPDGYGNTLQGIKLSYWRFKGVGEY